MLIMKKHIITLGGLPGSGKSTVKRILAQKFGYNTFSTGDFVRDMAAERNMTLEEFNDLVAHDKSLDEMIDERLEQIESEENEYIIDSHLAFHFVPSAFSVFLNISPEKSAERIFNDASAPSRIKSGDIMSTYEEALERTQRRIANHEDRYMRHYGINPYHKEKYLFTIDTENKTAEEVAEEVAQAYSTWLGE